MAMERAGGGRSSGYMRPYFKQMNKIKKNVWELVVIVVVGIPRTPEKENQIAGSDFVLIFKRVSVFCLFVWDNA